MKTVAAIHTTTLMVEPTKRLFAEYVPHVRLFNIADDSLIQDVIRDEKVTEHTARQLTGYYFAAVDAALRIDVADDEVHAEVFFISRE